MKIFTHKVWIGVIFIFQMQAQQPVKLVAIDGKELGVLVDVNQYGAFQEFFLFQYENLEMIEVLKAHTVLLLRYDVSYIQLYCDGKSYLLSVLDEPDDDANNWFKGYGLSHYKGNFCLVETLRPTAIKAVLFFDDLTKEGNTDILKNKKNAVGNHQLQSIQSIKCAHNYQILSEEASPICTCVK